MKRYIRSNINQKLRAVPKNKGKGATWYVDENVFKHLSDYNHKIPATSKDEKFETIIDDRQYDFYR